MSSKALTIYDAAAGAGKTYTLVKNYLLKVLASQNNGRYKQILAITFTNKAVSEMKERILSTLYVFAIEDSEASKSPMFLEIYKTLAIEPSALKERSLEVLLYILHNYTAFSVQTIDKFTQSIIRTFAFDLNLSNTFEVQLDQKAILEEAVDQLLMDVGKEKEITKTVLKYVAQQIDNDKSWDIKQLLIDLGMLLFKEGDQYYLTTLSEIGISDFLKLEKAYKEEILVNKNSIKKQATQLLNRLEQEQISGEFIRGTLPRYFTKLAENADVPLRDFILKDITEESFYAKSKDDNIKTKIDSLRPEIETTFKQTKALIYENKRNDGLIKNLPAMSLLTVLNGKIDHIKKEKNQVLISEFNSLIAENIKDQPTPFIYERLGEKFKDFFIDEFQDTSEVQWNNLMPLIDNALSSYIDNTEDTGTATLVGDAKQSIYRWRGGKAEQFLSLSEGNSPFANPEVDLFHLGTNYRSYSEIINFNNTFFSYLADFLSDTAYTMLYKKGNQQKVNSKEGGYISLELFDVHLNSERDEIYPEATLKYINEVLLKGYDYNDIAVLVRRNQEGVTISNYLIAEGVPVISSESLLIKNTLEVQLLEALLCHFSDIENIAFRLALMNKLSAYKKINNDSASLTKVLASDLGIFYDHILKRFNIYIPSGSLKSKTIYQLLEGFLYKANINTHVSANIQFFMDFVFDYCKTTNGGVQQFLDYWNTKKDNVSIITSEAEKGVKVMTIHKSKGLEFPVVIIPYLTGSLYDFKPSNIWVKNPNTSSEMTYLYWRFNQKVFDHFADTLVKDPNKLIAQEELDIINVLYVAFTRAVSHLYLLGSNKEAQTTIEKGNIVSFLYDFINFKNNEALDSRYTIGESVTKKLNSQIESSMILMDEFVYEEVDNKIKETPKYLNAETEATALGDAVHYALSQIEDRLDLNLAIKEIERLEGIDNNAKQLLVKQFEELLNDTLFEKCFDKKNIIFNERDFYGDGVVLRPDRIEILPNKKVVIFDYKTGKENPKHHKQLKEYESFVKKIGYENVNNYLIYFDETLKIVEVT